MTDVVAVELHDRVVAVRDRAVPAVLVQLHTGDRVWVTATHVVVLRRDTDHP